MRELIERLIESGELPRYAVYLTIALLLRGVTGLLRRLVQAPKAAAQASAPDPAKPRSQNNIHDGHSAPQVQQRRDGEVGVGGSNTSASEVARVGLTALQRRESEFSSAVRHDRVFDSLRELYEGQVRRPVEVAVLAARDGRGLARDRLECLNRRLRRFEALYDQRQDPDKLARAHCVERLATAAMAPLLSFVKSEGAGLTAEQVVVHIMATGGPNRTGVEVNDPDAGFFELRLGHGFGDRMADYDDALVRVGEHLFSGLDGLSEYLYGAMGLVSRPVLPTAAEGYDENRAYSAFGAWLPGLFGDVFLTLRGGPTRVSGLRAMLVSHERPAHAQASAGRFAAQVPPLLRMAAAVATLRHMGFSQQADDAWAAFELDHPEQIQALWLPQRGGAPVGIGSQFFHTLCNRIVDQLVNQPLPPLDDSRLREIPGLGFSLLSQDRLARQGGLAAKHGALEGTALDKWSAVTHAWVAGGKESRLLAVLRSAIVTAGSGHSRRAVDARDSMVELRHMMRDPRAVREAMAFGVAVAPRRSDHHDL